MLLHPEEILRRAAGVLLFAPESIAQYMQLSDIPQATPLVYLRMFFHQYFLAFRPAFLFFEGDPNLRHSLPGFGQLHPFMLIFIFAGIGWLIHSRAWKALLLLGGWFLIYPLPGALTVGSTADFFASAHGNRTLLGAPLYALAAAGSVPLVGSLGSFFWTHRSGAMKNVSLLMLTALGFCFTGLANNAHSYFTAYFHSYAAASHSWFGRKTQEAFPAVIRLASRGNRVLFMEGGVGCLDYYFAYYSKLLPSQFQRRLSQLDHHSLARPIGGIHSFHQAVPLRDGDVLLIEKPFPLEERQRFSGQNEVYWYIYNGHTLPAPLSRYEFCGPFRHEPAELQQLFTDTNPPLQKVQDCTTNAQWRQLQVDDGIVDFDKVLGANYENSLAILRTTVKIPTTGKYVLMIGYDDGLVLWVDGREVLHTSLGHSFGLDQAQFNLDLEAGQHDLLFSSVNQVSAWVFSARLVPQPGMDAGGDDCQAGRSEAGSCVAEEETK